MKEETRQISQPGPLLEYEISQDQLAKAENQAKQKARLLGRTNWQELLIGEIQTLTEML